MSMRAAECVLCLFIGLAGASPATDPADAQMLRAAGLVPEGQALLGFFRRRTQNHAGASEVAAAVARLSEPSLGARERATAELVSMGLPAVPFLRRAASDLGNVEAARRARRCLQLIEGHEGVLLTAAAARIVALHRPAGAAEALLGYLPLVEDDLVSDEIGRALGMLASTDAGPEPVLVRSLGDALALRRATAAEALSQLDVPTLRARIRALMDDPNVVVRLRAALALARHAHDPAAVSTLIALLADVPLVHARAAEDFLLQLAAEQAPQVGLSNDSATREKCRAAWAAWWQSTEGPTLLQEFRRRTLTDELRAQVLHLIRQLGADDFAEREKALTDLQGLGPAILSVVQQQTATSDAETASRLKKLILLLAKDKPQPLSVAVPRAVALRRPAEAVEVLLAYLPFADDPTIANEVLDALAVVGRRAGRPAAALAAALSDNSPVKRAASAEVIVQGGAGEQHAAIRKLLADGDASVRLRVALALARSGERDAIPVLLAAWPDVSDDLAARAEDYLRQVAGDRSPSVPLGKDRTERERCRDQWAAWWSVHGSQTNLTAVARSNGLLGCTLLVIQNPPRVLEVDRAGRTRWELTGLQHLYDAQALPHDRVLLAEYSAGRVTERTARNEIIWQKAIPNPFNARRLASGSTFIASPGLLVEVDRTGRELFRFERSPADIVAGGKLRDGGCIFVTHQGTCHRVDAMGKERATFAVGPVSLGGLEVLPSGRVLLARHGNQRVSEYEPDGRLVWEVPFVAPSSAQRLPGGTTLIASRETGRVVEVDRTGRVVWELREAQQAWKAARRQ